MNILHGIVVVLFIELIVYIVSLMNNNVTYAYYAMIALVVTGLLTMPYLIIFGGSIP